MQKLSTSQAILVSGIVFSVAFLATGLLAMNTNFYIKGIGGNDLSGGALPNTINVSGDGKVYARPDMVSFSVGVRETKATSKDAIDAVNSKIEKITEALKSEGISDKDYQTTNLSIYTDYDYQGSERRVIGQTANQTITVKVKGIDDKASKATKVIDKVSVIDNVEISGITFDIEDKTDLFTLARAEAFNKAEQKAKELASLGEVELLKPVSISDENIEYTPTVYQNIATFDKAAEGSDNSTSISTGQLEVRSSLTVVFGID